MKTRYVYYDKKNGNIKEILSKRRRGRAPYIECSNEEVEGFITGEKGILQWIVAFNRDTEKHCLLEKKNIIMLRMADNKLTKIPYKKNAETDIRLIYYTDNVLEITLDPSRISPLYQTNFRDEVRFEKGTEIRIVIKEKNSGNLLKEIIVEAQDLLDSVQIFFELYDHIYPDNVEFYTYKLLNSYSWQKGTNKLISPMKERIRFNIHRADHKPKSKDFEYHLVMTPTKTGLIIKNNIESLKLIRFYKDIEFFVVDKHDPNILYEKFFLDKEDLTSKKILVNLKENMNGKTILYNHAYIGVLLNE